jgi:hypothetical protein
MTLLVNWYNNRLLPLIMMNETIPAKKIAEILVISQERVGHIIHENLYMRELSAKWVPKYLNADQKRDQVLASQTILD